jgi:hypothetical protein
MCRVSTQIIGKPASANSLHGHWDNGRHSSMIEGRLNPRADFEQDRRHLQVGRGPKRRRSRWDPGGTRREAVPLQPGAAFAAVQALPGFSAGTKQFSSVLIRQDGVP